MPIALISTFNYRGLLVFARQLRKAGWTLIATDGTWQKLTKHKIEALRVSDITHTPPLCGGRVKTLHPTIFGGVLVEPGVHIDLPSRILPVIDLLVLNCYPFGQLVKEGRPPPECREAIDIGGPALVYAAAKSNRVTVAMDMRDYQQVWEALRDKRHIPSELRKALLLKALLWTAAYQVAIANWHVNQAGVQFPEVLLMALPLVEPLRYGENPHQSAALYGNNMSPVQKLDEKKALGLT